MNPSSSKALELIQKLNSSVLSRIDKDFVHIEATARLVHLYKWNNATSKWEDAKVFGPFFIYSRHKSPLYRMTILNREEPNDWVEAIDNAIHILDSTEAENMCVFMSPSQEVHGLWFSEQSENTAISAILKRTIEHLQKQPKQIGVDVLFESANKFSPSLNPASQPSQQFPTLSQSPHFTGTETQTRIKIEELFLPTSAVGSQTQPLTQPAKQAPQTVPTAQSCSSVVKHESTPGSEASIVQAVCQSIISTHTPEMTIFGDPPKNPKEPSKLPHHKVSRQNISDALMLLVQEDWFVDKVYDEYLRRINQ